MTKYTETPGWLKSASEWGKLSLERFGVEFDMEEDIEWETLINPRRYDPELETERKNFATCIMLLRRC